MHILIVGGGVAGTTLAHWCLENGITFRLADPGFNQSSAVAGGIINPLVFRRMTLSWRAGELIPFARTFYRRMETLLGQPFYHEVTIRRLFSSEQESGYWLNKQHLPEFMPFMAPQEEADRNYPSPQNTYGTGRVTGSAYVDAPEYCRAQLDWLREKGLLWDTAVTHHDIDPVAGTCNGESFDYILFCEGKDGKKNPWFNYLPLQQTKGELLTVKAPTISQAESLNRKCFMLPVGSGMFKVGSTYVWDTDNVEITEEGKQTILHNLASVTSEPVEVVQQVAGVRPTVTDRRPLLGVHPQFPKLVIANGLGTKGYMIAPLLMHELMTHLTTGQPLHPECDIARFTKH